MSVLLTEIEAIKGMHDLLSEKGVPKTEVLKMVTDDGENHGRCLSLIPLIVTAEKYAGESIWLQRASGEMLFALLYQGFKQYEIVQPG